MAATATPQPPTSPMVKRTRTEDAAPLTKRARGALNAITPPKNKLDVFVFGSGTICELGLGPNVTEVKRPRLNPFLPADGVGIVSVACGGAHTLALDHTGQLWSWGQNDSGALGRVTKETVGNEDNDLNALESTPMRVDCALVDDQFVSISASDSASVALTQRGRVYGWGTFIDDGAKAFDASTTFQTVPVLIQSIKNAVQIAAGKDHFVILTSDGHVYTWGVGTSFQLGYRVRQSPRSGRPQQRTQPPRKLTRLRNIVHVAAGDYTSYAINAAGNVFAWGLNNFGQCGIEAPVGPNAFIEQPTYAEFWTDKQIVQIAGGGHHSLWLSAAGDIYTVGETNFCQLGIPRNKFPENTVREQDGTPSFVPTPTRLVNGRIEDEEVALPPMKFVAVGTDHCLALAKNDGSCWTWGFGAVYQIGHGPDEEEEEIPRKIKNTATLNRNMVWAGAGGQFSVIASEHV